MPTEIERKFLLRNEDWRKEVSKTIDMEQGYFLKTDNGSVRVRIIGKLAYLTIKKKLNNLSRIEHEYEIPLADALEILDNSPCIVKTRHIIYKHGVVFEIDEFKGLNTGLVIAEVELEHENQDFPKPDWLGEEVTHESKYVNSRLIDFPYKDWKQE